MVEEKKFIGNEVEGKIKWVKDGLILGGIIPSFWILLLVILSHPIHFGVPWLGVFFGMGIIIFIGLLIIYTNYTLLLLLIFLYYWVRYKPKNLLTKEDWKSISICFFVTLVTIIIAFVLPISMPINVNIFVNKVMGYN
jgi:hypothetical protein